ncbi:MAG: SDR family oxidoreductase [Chloroflexi bacterium]|nr:SDR family oxidoreductase [Chloroflexota bacterium]
MRLEDQVAIVTGAGRGIGRATAVQLAEEGAAVVLAARGEVELAATAAEIAGRPGGQSRPTPLVVVCDITDPAQVEALVARTLAAHGRIDILVNNAGFAHQAPVEEITLANWQMSLAVNTTGTYLCSQAVLPAMRRQRSGKIINIVSGAGKRGLPRRTAYSAAKFGVIGFSQCLQQEVKSDGIAVSCICPGPVDTEMRTANNPGEDRSLLLQPEDLAEVIVFVATRRGMVVLPEMEVRPLPHM